MSTPIPLPAQLEPFIAYQEQLINRPLSEAEREATAAWLEVINETVTGELDRVTVLDRLGQLIEQSDSGPVLRFLEGVRHWLT